MQRRPLVKAPPPPPPSIARRIFLDVVIVVVSLVTCWTVAQTYTTDGFAGMVWVVVLLVGVTVGVVEWYAHARSTKSLLVLVVWLVFVGRLTAAMLYGTMTMTFWAAGENENASEKEMCMALVTIERSTGRREVFEKVARRLGFSYTEILGVDASVLPTTAATLRVFGMDDENDNAPPIEDKYRTTLSLTLNTRSALRTMEAQNPGADWIVLFEDDAHPFDWFPAQARRAMREYFDADVIWLNPVNALPWFVFGRPTVLTTGMMYRRDSVTKIAELLDYRGDFMRARRAIALSFVDDGAVAIDRVLETLCADGTLKCAAVPLVPEWGFPSTLFANDHYALKTGPRMFAF